MYINYIQCIGSCIIIRILKKLHTCTCTHTHTLRHTHTQTHIYTVHRHRHTDTHTHQNEALLYCSIYNISSVNGAQ